MNLEGETNESQHRCHCVRTLYGQERSRLYVGGGAMTAKVFRIKFLAVI